MIQPLKPLPRAAYMCPACGCDLVTESWEMPGMWCLAGLRCPDCREEFYGALAEGHGIFAPALIRRSDGSIAKLGQTPWTKWFAVNLSNAYRSRKPEDLPLEIKTLRPLEGKPLLLNCLDPCFGHALPKLLSAQQYLDSYPEYSLIAIVPQALEWLVPDGVAAVWVARAPLGKLGGWFDAMQACVSELLASWPEVWLASAPASVHSLKFDIARFTGVEQFDVCNPAMSKEMKVTFVWRDDRLLGVGRTALARLWHRGLARLLPQVSRVLSLYLQHRFVTKIAKAIRNEVPDADFAVAGMGSTRGRFREGILDLRSEDPDAATERLWCRRYAESHLVLGVHGSNMMLPSAHAGAVLTLISSDYRLLVPFSDTIFNEPGALHETMSIPLRYRMIPDSTDAATVARWVVTAIAVFPALTDIWNRPKP